MSEHISPVLWAGTQLVMALPEHLDSSNADEVREQLLVMIDLGAAVIIADLTATISCDYSGADALARAYRRAIVSGTQLRIAVGSNVVHRVLSINGLNRLVPLYPTVEAALAAGAGHASETAAATAKHADRVEDLLDSVVRKIFGAALLLRASTNVPADVTAARIPEVLRRLDEIVQEIRQHLVTGQASTTQPDPSPGTVPALHQRLALAAEHTTMLREQLIQTAYAIHSEAAGTAALLEQRREVVTSPGETDYPTEIKRWRNLAEFAEDMAQRWEQETDDTP